MNLTPPKLKPTHIYILAGVLAILIAVGAYFAVNPLLTENKALAANVESLMSSGSDIEKANAEKALADAEKYVRAQEASYRAIETRYMRIGPRGRERVLNLDVASEEQKLANLNLLALEQSRTLGPVIERWVRSTGNTLNSAISVPAPSTNPNALDNQDVIQIDMKGVRVSGTFQSIMRMLRSTRQLPRLVQISSVSLSAGGAADGTTTTPFASNNTVTADLDIATILFPRLPKGTVPNYPIPSGGAEGQGGDMGGGGGAMPMPSGMPGSGMPGGPPMAPGGPPAPAGVPGGPPPMPTPAAP